MREFKERDNYVIKVDGELVKVSREVYETYHRMERRERYLVERDQDNSLLFFFYPKSRGQLNGCTD